MSKIRGPLNARFDAAYQPVPWSGCWLWNGALNGTGYACIRDEPSNGSKQRRASHVSYERYIGKIPDGMIVLHSCDEPTCVNPAHLSVGTHLDNAKDRNAKGRQARQRGEDQGGHKLTWEKVRAIRSDTRPYTVIGKEYGVCISNISGIKNGKRWVEQ